MSMQTCARLISHQTQNCLQLVTPNEATEEVLLDVHTLNYLQQLKTSKTKIAQVLRKYHTTFICTFKFSSVSSRNTVTMQVTEPAILITLPNWLLQWRVVKPMRYMVAGTMLVSVCNFLKCCSGECISCTQTLCYRADGYCPQSAAFCDATTVQLMSLVPCQYLYKMTLAILGSAAVPETLHPWFVQAAALALERGWSINIGGGMHHAHSEGGAGWCMFSDLILAVRKLRKETQGEINKVMIIDTDVHQVWHSMLKYTHRCTAS